MPTFTPTVPYADVNYGNAYFGERLNASPWTQASPEDQLRALKQATLAIDNQNFAGEKAVETWSGNPPQPDQPRQFPRGMDTTVPDAICQATCELAIALLDGVDPNFEVENLPVVKQNVGAAHVMRDASHVLAHIRAGIPSIQAWMLIKPFLRDRRILDVDAG